MKVKIKIYGLVQGVFFRESAKEKAKELNIFCNPQNMADGTVEIAAEGEEKNVLQFIEWCKIGPVYAKIEKVEITKVSHETTN